MSESNDWNDAAYRELEKEALKDDRVGKHTMLVTAVVHDNWASGDPRTKVRGNLITAGNAKADFTISPPPAADIVKAEMATWDTGKKKAVAGSIAMHRALATHYSKSPDKLLEGDELRVQTAKNKEGFIRVIAILPPAKVVDGGAKDTIPF